MPKQRDALCRGFVLRKNKDVANVVYRRRRIHLVMSHIWMTLVGSQTSSCNKLVLQEKLVVLQEELGLNLVVNIVRACTAIDQAFSSIVAVSILMQLELVQCDAWRLDVTSLHTPERAFVATLHLPITFPWRRLNCPLTREKVSSIGSGSMSERTSALS